ncbi:subclass B1 metallo-beta-lactamase [Flavihumibacter petaseus]|nr:subclass B1 metallo-beta-lactamase [Flavihumibacter petaseus]
MILPVLLATLHCCAQKTMSFGPRIVYRSDRLEVTRISAHAYEHTTYLQTQDFGKVPCNGLIVNDAGEAVIFDTPADDSTSEELIAWVKDSLQSKVKAVIPTHFHNDCLGGLKAFHQQAIASYAYFKTIEYAREHKVAIPQNSFQDSLVLSVGKATIMAKYFGEGHTRDNVVGYFPGEHILFGGCLVKEIDASKGYLGDANVAAWSATVERVKKAFPDVKIVIPGHGAYGEQELLDYTIRLFRH